MKSEKIRTVTIIGGTVTVFVVVVALGYLLNIPISESLLIIAILTFAFTTWQTYLARKALRGETYERPPLRRVGFLKPLPKYESDVGHDNRVRFNKMVEGDNWIFEEVTLPKNSQVNLAITWCTKEKQSLQHVRVGFGLGHKVKPRIVRSVPWWAAKDINPLKPIEYIDLDGYYHIEYRISRKFGKGAPFIAGFRIETGSRREYRFCVNVYSEEAKESFEKILKVTVE